MTNVNLKYFIMNSFEGHMNEILLDKTNRTQLYQVEDNLALPMHNQVVETIVFPIFRKIEKQNEWQ